MARFSWKGYMGIANTQKLRLSETLKPSGFLYCDASVKLSHTVCLFDWPYCNVARRDKLTTETFTGALQKVYKRHYTNCIVV